MIDFIKENCGLAIFTGFLALIFVLLVISCIFWQDPIPNCEVCGEPAYYTEVDYYVPMQTFAGDVPIMQMIPIYKTIQHKCKGAK